MKQRLEKRSRSVVKAIAYRTLSITVDSLVAYFFTKNFVATLSIVIIVNGYSAVLYYIHEPIWSRIAWGRNIPRVTTKVKKVKK